MGFYSFLMHFAILQSTMNIEYYSVLVVQANIILVLFFKENSQNGRFAPVFLVIMGVVYMRFRNCTYGDLRESFIRGLGSVWDPGGHRGSFYH